MPEIISQSIRARLEAAEARSSAAAERVQFHCKALREAEAEHHDCEIVVKVLREVLETAEKLECGSDSTQPSRQEQPQGERPRPRATARPGQPTAREMLIEFMRHHYEFTADEAYAHLLTAFPDKPRNSARAEVGTQVRDHRALRLEDGRFRSLIYEGGNSGANGKPQAEEHTPTLWAVE